VSDSCERWEHNDWGDEQTAGQAWERGLSTHDTTEDVRRMDDELLKQITDRELRQLTRYLY